MDSCWKRRPPFEQCLPTLISVFMRETTSFKMKHHKYEEILVVQIYSYFYILLYLYIQKNIKFVVDIVES